MKKILFILSLISFSVSLATDDFRNLDFFEYNNVNELTSDLERRYKVLNKIDGEIEYKSERLDYPLESFIVRFEEGILTEIEYKFQKHQSVRNINDFLVKKYGRNFEENDYEGYEYKEWIFDNKIVFFKFSRTESEVLVLKKW